MPEWKPEILRRLAPLKLAPTREAEIAEELAQHLDDRYQELIASGQSEDAAFRAALDELKGEELLARSLRPVEQSDYREPIAPGTTTGNFFSGVLQDIRYALRMLRKSPGFTAVAVLTLALGIGANTAIFSVVNTVLIKPLPYPHPEQLVNMWRTHGTWTGSISVPDFNDWQNQSTDFQGMSLYDSVRFNLRGTNEPQAVEGARVSPNFFDMMQKPLYLGRGFATGEDQPGANRVVVLSYELWQNEFGGDRSLVGRMVQLNGTSFTVAGVAGPNFHFPHPVTALWVPLTPLKEQMTRGSHDFVGIGRIKPGISIPQAREQLNAISARLAKTYPDTDAQLGALLIPLKDATVGGIRSSLLIVFAVMGFVFLIACANVSSYVLSRAEARRRELAIRAALGAGRGRLVRQFFAEGLVLALLGALLAAFTVRWSVQAIVALASLYFSDPGRIRPDATVFAFTLGLAAIAAVLLSMGVAWNASRMNVHETLKEGAQTASGGRRTLVMQKILIVLQLSIACLLLVTAGGMIESLARLSRLNPGFDPHHVLVMRIPLPPQNNSPAHPAWLFFGPALERIKALPGVKSTAVITYLPMQSWGTNSGFQVQGRAKVAQSEAPWSEVRAISPDYFRVMGIHLLQGRWFNAGDTANSENVLVVNRAFVRKYFPKENILGQRIDFTDEGHWQTIVGVVDDSHQTGLDTEVLPEADEPCTQANWAYLTQTMSLAVRTEGDPLLLARSVEQAIYSQDPSQAVYGVKTMDDVVAETEANQRFVLWLLGLFAGLAVLLSCTGLFGQVSYAVGQRTHEIGVRMALGAQRSRIAKMILRQGGWLVAAGLAAGVAASFGLSKLMASLLYGVKPAGLVATLASIALLAVVGLFACYIPARRAMRVDPMVALRYE